MGDHHYVNNWPDHSKLLLSATHLERESERERGGKEGLKCRGRRRLEHLGKVKADTISVRGGGNVKSRED